VKCYIDNSVRLWSSIRNINRNLDLEEMIARKEKPRTGSATDASMVENTSVLRLGFKR
jgi:hypothetical protein